MNKLTSLLLAAFTLLAIGSCKKDSEPATNKNVVAEKTNVQTFEIVSLIVHTPLKDKYDATFGSLKTELLKTSDTTLTFYVPDVAAGKASLKFDLATISFDVTKPAAVDAGQMIAAVSKNFDDQITRLHPSTPDEKAEVDELIKYKQEVLALFNKLTDDEKRQAASFYEANKAVFQSFANSTFTNLDAATQMKLQSDCPKTDFKTFYGCTADNLGSAATGLKNASKEFLKMLALAGTSAYLAPASFGLSAFGTTLALGTAGYLLITEVKPAVTHFKKSLYPFLGANWIFTKALFQATTEVFQDEVSTSLNLKPKFRSITSMDNDITPGSSYFVTAMASLSSYWNKLTSVFGSFPSYKNTEASTTLATSEISISNISNPNVQYFGHTGQSAKFKSLSGNEETFSYDIRVSKEGFVESKTLMGKVVAKTCDPNSIIGTWTVEFYNTCYPNSDGTPALDPKKNTLTLYAGGQSVFTYYDGSQYNGTYTINPSDCSFTYTNLSWCGGARGYAPSSPDYGRLHSCGCLSLKHTKQ